MLIKLLIKLGIINDLSKYKIEIKEPDYSKLSIFELLNTSLFNDGGINWRTL